MDEELLRILDEMYDLLKRVNTLPAHCKGAILYQDTPRVLERYEKYCTEHSHLCTHCGQRHTMYDACPDCKLEQYLNNH